MNPKTLLKALIVAERKMQEKNRLIIRRISRLEKKAADAASNNNLEALKILERLRKMRSELYVSSH